MKSFDEFEAYIKANGQSIHENIVKTSSDLTAAQKFDDLGEEHEFYRRAFVENGIMIMLRHYHEWLNA